MNLHANAKLGLAGRRRLVEAIDAGMTLNGCSLLQRVAGDRAPLVAALDATAIAAQTRCMTAPRGRIGSRAG